MCPLSKFILLLLSTGFYELVIKNSIQLYLRTLMFSIVLRHSNYNNRIIFIEGTFFWDVLLAYIICHSHFALPWDLCISSICCFPVSKMT